MSEEVEGRTLEQLQDMAAEQDRLSGYSEGEHPAEVPAAEIEQRRNVGSEPKPEPEKPKEETKIEAPESKSEKPSPEPEADAGPPEVPDSSLTVEVDERTSKSEKRLNESWRKLNATKEELADKERELEELRGTLNERAQPAAYVDEDGNTAEDYDAAAKNFELDGEGRLAEKAREQAERVREMGRNNQVESNDNQFKKEWGDNFDRAADSYPELRDANSTFRKAVNGILQERPVLATYSGGIVDAADIVAMQMKVESSGQLQEQINTLQKENDGLKTKLSIGGSEPSSAPVGSRAFSELTSEEQFAELQRRAAEVDAAVAH
tara:strand:- start:3172 stop:4137 length:966 start_codon:yes stop_codon:yes gene_type:complete